MTARINNYTLEQGRLNLSEIIPIGGIFSIQVPAVERGHVGIVVMKLKDDEFVKLLGWDGLPCFELISKTMVYYPITGYYGVFGAGWSK